MFYEVLSRVHSPDVLRIAIRNNKLHVYGGGWREKPLSWSVCLLLPHPQSFNTSIHSLHSQWISVMCRRRMFWTCEQFLTRRSLRSTLENTYEQERLSNNTGRVSNKAKQTRENSAWPNDLRRYILGSDKIPRVQLYDGTRPQPQEAGDKGRSIRVWSQTVQHSMSQASWGYYSKMLSQNKTENSGCGGAKEWMCKEQTNSWVCEHGHGCVRDPVLQSLRGCSGMLFILG